MRKVRLGWRALCVVSFRSKPPPPQVRRSARILTPTPTHSPPSSPNGRSCQHGSGECLDFVLIIAIDGEPVSQQRRVQLGLVEVAQCVEQPVCGRTRAIGLRVRAWGGQSNSRMLAPEHSTVLLCPFNSSGSRAGAYPLANVAPCPGICIYPKKEFV